MSSSTLWGIDGNLWKTDSRLPDFSRVGYKPSPPKSKVNIKDYGAIGDGKTDDTFAILKAVESLSSGIIYFPPGKYVITQMININKSIVLMGSEDETTFYMPKSLEEIYGNTATSTQNSQWATSPAFINFKGQIPLDLSTKLCNVVKEAERGSEVLRVDNSSKLKVGDWIVVSMSDVKDSGALVEKLLGNYEVCPLSFRGMKNVVRFVTTVSDSRKNRVVLSQRLPVSVESEWQTEIYKYSPTLSNAGIENIIIEFAPSVYNGHLKEKGYNGLFFNNVSNSRVKNIVVINADNAIWINNSYYCTVDKVVVKCTYDRSSKGMFGHHAITVSRGSQNLVQNFDIQQKYYHDIGLENFGMLNVYTKGKGVDLCMDHHKTCPHSNLMCDIDVGDGNRPFDSGGGEDLGPNTGAYATFWNIRSKKEFELPPSNFGPLINFIAVKYNGVLPPNTQNWLIENIDPSLITPSNIYDSMIL